jgi:hypothetical protein
VISAVELALWLAAGNERVDAMADLVASGDLLIVPDGDDGFGLIRTHDDQVTRFECPMPPLPAAAA